MKSLRIVVMLAGVTLAFAIGASAQVTVTGSTGANASYASLNAAFTAINGAGTQAGNNILVAVSANTTETVTASLDAGNWTSLTVRPTAAVTVSGTITGAIIKLNGADNVTIDGRIGGVGSARSLTVSNASTVTASAAIWLSSLGAGAGAMNNIVRNLEIAGGVTNTNTSSTYGIIMSGVSITTTSNGEDNDNNQFIFNRIIRARYGIVTRGLTTNLNIAPIVTDNIIGPTAFGPDQIGKTGILMQADTGAVVSRNTIQFVGGDLANTTGGADRIGIGIGTEAWSLTSSTTLISDTYTVTKNVIHDVVEERTFSSVGILLGTSTTSAPTNNVVANNFIYNVRANATSPDQLTGIGISGGLGDKVVFNSISLTGDQDPGATTTSVIFGNGIRLSVASSATHGNLTLADNSIYIDASSNNTATTRYYAITGTSSAYSFGTGFENYNNYYLVPANTQLQTGGFATATGASATTEFATLANWQTAYTVPQDANSIQANPNYASVTSDLHLIGGSPNIDTGLTIAGVADDIDAQVRPNGPAPDIGADEFYAAPGALQFSSATYAGSEGTTLMATVNRVSGSSGVVGVTYTLANGTATGGAACTAGVDFINSGPQMVSFGNTVTSQPINVMLCSDAVVDPLETFTITLSAPTGGATLGSPTVATVTITDIPPPFNGTYTVGTAGTYSSLTNPGGIFEAINMSGATGNVTINITSDLTGETGTNALNEIAGGFTVLIKPSGAPRSITGSSTVSLIKLNGADNVKIDGSTAAMFAENVVGGDPALRQLTITNTNTGALIWIATNATSGATGNIIRNLNMVGAGGFAGQGIIAGSGATFGAAAENGRPNSNNTVDNTTAKGVQNAIFAIGDSVTLDDNWVITQNDFGSAVGAEKISFRGIAVQNAQNFTISQNRISGISSSTTTSATMSGILIGAVINGGSVTRNNITDIRQNNTVGWGSNGIYLTTSSAAANLLVANNFVSDVASNGFAGVAQSDNGYGIMVNAGGGFNIYSNSVNMNTNQVAAGSITAAINIASAVSAAGSVDLRNNVFSNTQTIGTRYGTYVASNAAIFPAGGINFNDYFAQNVGFLTSARATLGDWQAATGQDANSVAIDPLFVAPIDLHLQSTSPLLSVGTPIGTVVTDFDADPRPASLPEIGADELVQSTASSFPAGTFYNAIGANNDVLLGNVTITNSLTLTGTVAAGPNTLTLGCNAAVTGAGGINYVIGNFAKQFCATTGGTPFVFPVGTVADGSLAALPEYSPFSANVTVLGTNPSTLSVSVTDALLPDSSPTESATRYWDVTKTGNLTADITFTYLDQDVNGNEATYRVLRRSGTTLAVVPCVPSCINPATNTATVLGISNFSQWAAGNLSPTAANATVGGRVLTAEGRGIYGARVIVLDPTSTPRMARTNPFGYYQFSDVTVGSIYVFSVSDKRYQFEQPSIVRSISGNDSGINFIAIGGAGGDRPSNTYFDNAPFDFDGDGLTDASVFRDDSNSWLIRRSSDNTYYSFEFGARTDRLAAADFDGDGRTDPAVFRPETGTWYIRATDSVRSEKFGMAGDIPMPSDFDGDGRADLAVWRPGKNVLIVKQSSDGQTFEIESGGGSPRVGDYDGDGRAELAVFNSERSVWQIRFQNGKSLEIAFEADGDIPLFADFDGDGQADIGVYNSETGVWTIRQSRSGGILQIQNGGGTDKAVIGDFDGDGRTDAAVFRNGTWLIRQSVSNAVRAVEFGLPTDRALPMAGKQ